MQKTLAIHIQYFRISSARITRNVIGSGPKENKLPKQMAQVNIIAKLQYCLSSLTEDVT